MVALLYQKINEAIENGIQVMTEFSCSMLHRNVSDVIWVQILGTLLDNAIEALADYEGNKKLWITIRESKEDSNKVKICIVNTYYKQKQKDLEQFFKLGYSTKGENRGVGLYDVKMLVHKHHGELVFENITGMKMIVLKFVLSSDYKIKRLANKIGLRYFICNLSFTVL